MRCRNRCGLLQPPFHCINDSDCRPLNWCLSPSPGNAADRQPGLPVKCHSSQACSSREPHKCSVPSIALKIWDFKNFLKIFLGLQIGNTYFQAGIVCKHRWPPGNDCACSALRPATADRATRPAAADADSLVCLLRWACAPRETECGFAMVSWDLAVKIENIF